MEENNKFWSLNGVISRRTFIINLLLVLIVGLITFVAPIAILLFFNPEILADFTLKNSNISQLPVAIIVWIILATILRLTLIFPSIVRRLRDMFGKDDSKIIPVVATFLVLVIFASYLPFIKYVYYALMICLMTIEGQITNQKPKSEVIKFNWGAFWGTWIWGLCNKCYKTLWVLLLWPLTGILPFMLLFGLKGNQWAYKNNEFENIEDFHKKQSNQALIFGFAFPFLLIFSVFSVFYGIGKGLEIYSKNHPEFNKQIANYYVKVQNSNTQSLFENIELKDEEYIFSIDPKIWVKFTTKQQQRLFETASFYAESNSNKKFTADENNLSASKTTLNKVKIISTYNEEILAKCGELKDIKDFPQDCKFNSNPSLP